MTSALNAGDTIGRFRIESVLGRGGMGEVYVAEDSVLQRQVALKILRVDGSRAGENAEEIRARLLKEARAGARLHHPNIVTIFEVGDADGVPFIAMELVRGTVLRKLVKDRNQPVERRIRWMIEMARALGALHRSGFVHRDIKPDNAMILDESRALKLLDFGTAKAAGSDAAPSSMPSTAPGHVVGTPNYMAPEQMMAGWPLDPRCDQFCWAITAWEVIAGEHPSKHGFDVRTGAPAPLLSEVVPDVPLTIAAVVARALATAPENRLESMDSVADALELRVDAPLQARPASAAQSAAETAPTRSVEPPATRIEVASPPRATELRDDTNHPVMTLAEVKETLRSPHGLVPSPKPSAAATVDPRPSARVDRRIIGGVLGGAVVLGGLSLWANRQSSLPASSPSPVESAEPATVSAEPSAAPTVIRSASVSVSSPTASASGSVAPSAVSSHRAAPTPRFSSKTLGHQCDNPDACIWGEACVNGRCACDSEFTLCNGVCDRLMLSKDNCGRCGNRCAPNERCQVGRCMECNNVQFSTCNNVCVNTFVDRAHCGKCYNKCAIGLNCISGNCQ